MAGANAFTFDDAGSFDENLKAFAAEIASSDSVLGPALIAALGSVDDRGKFLDTLLAALKASAAAVPPVAQAAIGQASATASQPSATKPPRWFLEQIEIEGFRGINNEGSPLVLKFKVDAELSRL